VERDQLWADDFAVRALIGSDGAQSNLIDILSRLPGNLAAAPRLGV
jgi:hypothetical protein